MKHTSGPWKILTWDEGNDIAIMPNKGGVAICSIVTVNGIGIETEESLETGKANARLIASAPSLLLACESAVEWLGACEWPEGYGAPKNFIAALDVLKAAIARAEGE